jgi:hypothetical protein
MTTVWDVLTWAALAVLGPGVVVLCLAVARDVHRLLGAPGVDPGCRAARGRRPGRRESPRP